MQRILLDRMAELLDSCSHDAAGEAFREFMANAPPWNLEAEGRAMMAASYATRGRWRESIAEADSILNRKDSPVHATVMAGLAKAEAMEYRGSLMEAWQCASRSRARAENSGMKNLVLTSRIAQAGIQSRQGEHGLAGKELDSVLKEIGKNESTGHELRTLMARALVSLGADNLRRGNAAAAFLILKRALFIETEQRFSPEYGEAMRYMGIVHSINREYNAALECFSSSLAINKRCGCEPRLSRLYGAIGRTYLDAGNLNKASMFFHKALAISRRLGMEAPAAEMCSMLGHVAMDREDFAAALDFYAEDYEITRNLKNPHALAYVHKNLGVCTLNLGRVSEAKEHLLKALGLFRQVGDIHDEALVKISLGTVALAENDVSGAREYAAEGRLVIEDLERAADMAQVHLLEARIALAGEEHDRALEILELAEKSLGSGGSSRRLIEILHEKALTLSRADRKKEARATLDRAFGIARTGNLSKSIHEIGNEIGRMDTGLSMNCGFPEGRYRDGIAEMMTRYDELTALPASFEGLAVNVAIHWPTDDNATGTVSTNACASACNCFLEVFERAAGRYQGFLVASDGIDMTILVPCGSGGGAGGSETIASMAALEICRIFLAMSRDMASKFFSAAITLGRCRVSMLGAGTTKWPMPCGWPLNAARAASAAAPAGTLMIHEGVAELEAMKEIRKGSTKTGGGFESLNTNDGPSPVR